ncbi:MAG: aminotransferase class I/II-fold pyridoxal phosphate-dependent enzyme [Clostridia bacterium]|nr:aminotransferase class I/II-fold pyridoxal phosphate-dependent enzyme [Clostridia bacterium]
MLTFTSDYIAGAHPQVLAKLVETNLENLSGYGTDIYCQSAAEKIKAACALGDEADVVFLAGGTQTNQIVISTLLAPYEGVIAAQTGHVSLHEAGAIEYSGHKVIQLECKNGKLEAGVIRDFLRTYHADENKEQMVLPGMVYISFPTEYGTLYSKSELEGISAVCKEYEIPLFVDGARLGYGLESYDNDVTLQELAALCDVFYIGGTKVGALCGEAVVFTRGNLPKHMSAQVKQHGGLLAKGRLLGVQFDALFSGNLYFEISRHAIEMAEKLKTLFKEKGYDFFIDSPTNQQFVILENGRMKELEKEVNFCFWEKFDDAHTVVRFATSWSTKEEDIEALGKLL